MRIERYMEQADGVLKAFIRLFGKALRAIREGELAVQAYRNGRENGYVLTLWRFGKAGAYSSAVTFSEDRASDDIAIYPGDMVTASDKDGEALFKECVTVKPENYERAARVVAKMLEIG